MESLLTLSLFRWAWVLIFMQSYVHTGIVQISTGRLPELWKLLKQNKSSNAHSPHVSYTYTHMHRATHTKTSVQITKLALSVPALFKYYLKPRISNYSASYRTNFKMNLPLTSRGFYLFRMVMKATNVHLVPQNAEE